MQTKLKIVGVTAMLLLTFLSGYSQERKYFRKADLEADLMYIADKIRNVQNAPFLYCKEEDFERETERIRKELQDSMALADFARLVYPLLKMSGDEHARILDEDPRALFKPKENNAVESQLSGVGYEKIGKTGILTVEHFRIGQGVTMELWEKYIDSLARQIQEDGIERLLIDVSHNGGGSSNIGDLLIAYFCPHPYYSYSMTWKRSDDYLDFFKSLGGNDSHYEALKCGEYFIKPSQLVQPPEKRFPYRGRLWVAVGGKTFSSAMMFATVIKDNRLACLIGETPEHGHPNHFGEMIFLQAPRTGLNFGFGVKQFIRPSGEKENNILEPDVKIDLSKIKAPADWVPYLESL